MDARLTIANMTTEWGALVGWFPVDEITLAYLEARDRELRAQGVTRIPEDKFADWRSNPPAPDPGCSLRRPHRARPRRGHAACFRPGHRAGHAVGRGDREEESRDSEGVSRLLRELAAGRSGSRGAGACEARRSPTACSSISPPPAARCRTKPRSAASGRRCSTPARSRCRPDADRASAWAPGLLEAGRGRNLRDQPQLQRPHGIARRPVLSRQSGGCGGFGGRRLHLRACANSQSREIDATLRRVRSCRPHGREGGDPSRISRSSSRTAGLSAAGQPEHRRHLRQGLHLSRRHDAGDDGAGGDGELRSAIRRADRRRATWWSAASTSAPAPAASRR